MGPVGDVVEVLPPEFESVDDITAKLESEDRLYRLLTEAEAEATDDEETAALFSDDVESTEEVTAAELEMDVSL